MGAVDGNVGTSPAMDFRIEIELEAEREKKRSEREKQRVVESHF